MTRQDGRDFLKLAEEIKLQTLVATFELERINEGLRAVLEDWASGPAVVIL